MVNPGLKRFAVLQESRNRRASGVRPPAARDGFFRIGLIDTILRRHKSRSRSPPRCARIVGEGSKLMRPDFPFLCRRLAGLTCVLLLLTSSASATDVEGALAVAADQPQVTMVVRGSYSGNPFTADGNVGYIQAFLDTGCSGILLSQETASVLYDGTTLGLPSSTYTNPSTQQTSTVTFQDVGVGGGFSTNVSKDLYYSVGTYSMWNEPSLAALNQTFGPVRCSLIKCLLMEMSELLDVVVCYGLQGRGHGSQASGTGHFHWRF